MDCADLARIINSDQVQSKLREMIKVERAHDKTKKNPLKNRTMMQKLNPNFKANAALEAKANVTRKATRAKLLKEKRSKVGKAAKSKRNARYNAVDDGLK